MKTRLHNLIYLLEELSSTIADSQHVMKVTSPLKLPCCPPLSAHGCSLQLVTSLYLTLKTHLSSRFFPFNPFSSYSPIVSLPFVPLSRIHTLSLPTVHLPHSNISSIPSCMEDEVKERKKPFNPSLVLFSFLKASLCGAWGAAPVSAAAAGLFSSGEV